MKNKTLIGMAPISTVAWIRAVGFALVRVPGIALAMLVCVPGICPMLSGQGDGGGGEEVEQGLRFHSLDLLDDRNGYSIPMDSSFLPGEKLHVFFQIAGYSVGTEDRILLRYRVDAFDPEGRRFHMAEGGEFDAELAPQDDNWTPAVHYSPQIPQHAGGGTYAIRITVTDALAGETVSAEIPIRVDGARVQLADDLLIRDFRFSKSDGGSALEDPVFESGEQIWATFYITGYETREDNTYNVESTARVLDAAGKQLHAFESQNDAGSPYYPRLWLPAKFRLDLEETIPAGVYTVVLGLYDKVENSRSTERYTFRVR